MGGKVELNKIVIEIVRERQWLDVVSLSPDDAKLEFTETEPPVTIVLQNCPDMKAVGPEGERRFIEIKATSHYSGTKASIAAKISVPYASVDNLANDIGHKIDALVANIQRIVLHPFGEEGVGKRIQTP